jgi:DsbC/DsbD-like thiol-disulfide interchange protein
VTICHRTVTRRVFPLGSASAIVIGSFVAVGAAVPPDVQPPGAAASSSEVETPHLAVRTSSSAPHASAGGRVSLFVDVTLKPTMHVYAPEEKEAIPVTLTLAPGDAFKPAAQQFPKAEKFFFAPLKLTQLVYSKSFRIAQPVTIAKASAAGSTLEIKGTFRYQACDDKVCYSPRNVPVAWELQIR